MSRFSFPWPPIRSARAACGALAVFLVVVAQGAPVWIAGAEREMNAFYGFAAEFDVGKGDRPVLRLSAGAIARVWVNGKFAGYGPARAPEGFCRVDEWPLGDFVTEGRNVIAIEVSNPAVNTFYLPEQSGFLDAEVVCSGRILAETGRARSPSAPQSGFRAVRLPRIAKASRFSYMREFAEFYTVTPESYAWRTNGLCDSTLQLVHVPSLKPLSRVAPRPTFAFDGTFRPTLRTSLRRDPARKVKKVSCTEDGGKGSFKGFAKEELEVNFSDAVQQLVAEKIEDASRTANPKAAITLAHLEGVVFEGSRNTAGFPKLDIRCTKPTTVWLVMDELADSDGLPNPVRYFNCVNACGWRLEAPGDYSLECFQPYCLKCAAITLRRSR